jgi:hypothetical protein
VERYTGVVRRKSAISAASATGLEVAAAKPTEEARSNLVRGVGRGCLRVGAERDVIGARQSRTIRPDASPSAHRELPAIRLGLADHRPDFGELIRKHIVEEENCSLEWRQPIEQEQE